jgi:hypothetical protein
MKDPEWKKLLEEDYKNRGQRKPVFYSDSNIELADVYDQAELEKV